MDTGISILIGAVLLMSLYMFQKISRFFAGMLMLLIGIGIMYVEVTHAWIGWIPFATGFYMMILAIFTPKKKVLRRR